MPRLTELKLNGKGSSENGLSAIQLIFSDGISSPIFFATGSEDTPLVSYLIDDGASIRTIVSQAAINARNNWINKISLRNEK